MFTKFKKNDSVLLNNDLSQMRCVVKVWEEVRYDWGYAYYTEKVALNDDAVYDSEDLTFYSKPLQIMAIQMEILKKEIEILKKKRK